MKRISLAAYATRENERPMTIRIQKPMASQILQQYFIFFQQRVVFAATAFLFFLLNYYCCVYLSLQVDNESKSFCVTGFAKESEVVSEI